MLEYEKCIHNTRVQVGQGFQISLQLRCAASSEAISRCLQKCQESNMSFSCVGLFYAKCPHGRCGRVGRSVGGSTFLLSYPIMLDTSPILHNEWDPQIPSGSKSTSGSTWQFGNGYNIEGNYGSLLKDFKINKRRCFELSNFARNIFWVQGS